MSDPIKIYQAPLQGFTDFTFRSIYARVFGRIDKYFIPYISFGKGHEIKRSQLKEVFPENNPEQPVVPQVLFSDEHELIELVKILVDFGYREINLNLGCPYPMATNKGRGSAWLQKPDRLEEALQKLYSAEFSAVFSVKMRAGMTNDQDFLPVMKILNQFPLEEVIFHPRTADQMYDGKANPQLFVQAFNMMKHPMIYNGDIFNETDFQLLSGILPAPAGWMIGRGLLSDPFLPGRLKNDQILENQQREKKRIFHDQVLEAYSARLDGSGHILMKMNQFWTYFSQSFNNPHKAMKLVKKSGNMQKYNAAVTEIFNNL